MKDSLTYAVFPERRRNRVVAAMCCRFGKTAIVEYDSQCAAEKALTLNHIKRHNKEIWVRNLWKFLSHFRSSNQAPQVTPWPPSSWGPSTSGSSSGGGSGGYAGFGSDPASIAATLPSAGSTPFGAFGGAFGGAGTAASSPASSHGSGFSFNLGGAKPAAAAPASLLPFSLNLNLGGSTSSGGGGGMLGKRELYVGNIPLPSTNIRLKVFFDTACEAAFGVDGSGLKPVVKTEINTNDTFAFVEVTD
jgi:hypothetical protein